MFFVWSGWPGRRDGQQNLYIAPMSNPFTLSGPRVLIAQPDQPWERIAMPICEGPQVLQNNGKTFVVYSASGSWTEDYCLGLLTNNDGDLLNPASWIKRPTPVFQKTDHVWGLGHCSFVKSPCRTEDWIIYHSKSSKEEGWADRDVHAKQFTWAADGSPDFGLPLPRARTLPFDPTWKPSDENLYPENPQRNRRLMFDPSFHNHFAGVAKAQTRMTEPRRFRFDGLRGTLKSLLGTILILGCVETSFGDSLPGKVKVMTERDGANTRFLAAELRDH